MTFVEFYNLLFEDNKNIYIVCPVLDCGTKKIKANTHDDARDFGLIHGLPQKVLYDTAIPKFLLSSGELTADRKLAYVIADKAGQLQPWYDAINAEDSIEDKEEYISNYRDLVGLQSQLIDFDIEPSFLNG